MKKNVLWISLCYLSAGLLCALAAALAEGKASGLLAGFAGAGIGAGGVLLWKYVYWSRPQNAPRYRERAQRERIEQKDERNERLRDKAGRYTYLLGLLVLALADVTFAILDATGAYECKGLILFSGFLLLFLYIAGIVIYRRLKAHY